MSRLTEALERARETAGEPVAAPAASTVVDVPTAWDFDEKRQPPSSRGPAPIDVESDAPGEYRFSAEAGDKIVVGATIEPALVEQYRRLAAVLHHHQRQHGSHSVMIASAVAAEGKTLTATNVALTLSHSYQRRVLLIDADLRRPSLHTMFGLPNQRGLIDLLVQPGSPRPPVHRVSPTLWVLTAGPSTPDPMSALTSEAMKQLIAEASEQFDWVVLDTPPVALMPDANLLAAMIDTALMVVGANTTPYPLARRAIDAIGPSRVLGVVLNRAEKHQVAGEYGYYYGYARGSKRDKAERRSWLRSWPFGTRA